MKNNQQNTTTSDQEEPAQIENPKFSKSDLERDVVCMLDDGLVQEPNLQKLTTQEDEDLSVFD